jgi:parallel beta-helix repeat protein
MKRPLATSLFLTALLSPAFQADEGNVPLFRATTITQPGRYVLTRDIAVSGGAVIVVQAGNVTLDLHGHTISSSSGSGELILVMPGATDVTIGKGRLKGGSFGIYYNSSSDRLRARIFEVDVVNPSIGGIAIDGAEEVEIRSCHVALTAPDITGVRVSGIGGPFKGRLVDNTVTTNGGHGLYLDSLLGGEVRGNRISSTGSLTGHGGLVLTGPATTPHGANLIQDNTVILSGGHGIVIDAESFANQLLGNEAAGSQFSGIVVLSNGNRVSGNMVSGNVIDGITVGGRRNLVEGNVLSDNAACGIDFSGTGATNNAYRNNMVSGSPGSICGTSNLDAGGNIL